MTLTSPSDCARISERASSCLVPADALSTQLVSPCAATSSRSSRRTAMQTLETRARAQLQIASNSP